jgi:hypothetical protein
MSRVDWLIEANVSEMGAVSFFRAEVKSRAPLSLRPDWLFPPAIPYNPHVPQLITSDLKMETARIPETLA